MFQVPQYFIVALGESFDAHSPQDVGKWFWQREGRIATWGEGFLTRDLASADLARFLASGAK